MNKQNIIFDLDGTLLDTTNGILESVEYTISQLHLSSLTYEQLLTFVGPPVQLSFVNHYGLSTDEAQQAADIFRAYYKSEALFKAKPYNGIYELLASLRQNGKHIGVATYKREDYAIDILCHFGFDKYCASMRGADNNNQLTKSDIIRLCITDIQGTFEESLLIGDTKHDAIGAHQAGIDFLGVTYGFGFKSKADVDEYPNVGCAEKVENIEKIILA